MQPYVLEESDVRIRFNLRKLNELPFHLVRARRMNEFNDYIVFDFDFLLNKLRGTSRYLLLRDLELPGDEGVENIEEANLVYNALRLAAFSLVTDPTNLVVDLLARLANFEEANPRTHLLLQQVRRHGAEVCCLMPTRQFFESGSGALSTSFDVGLSMGIVLHDKNLAVISLVVNEIEIYDENGNHLKTFKMDHNVFLGLKYLLRLMPLRHSTYNLVIYGPMRGILKVINESTTGYEARMEQLKEEDRLIDESEGVEKDEDEKMEKEMEEKNETEENEKEKGDTETEKEKEVEKNDEEEEEIDDSKRPIHVIKLDFSTGSVDLLWDLPPKIRKNVSLDDVDFVGIRFFVKIPKKYFTTMTVYDIQKKELVFEQTNCFLWATDISNDERMCFWSQKSADDQGVQITFRNMETHEQFVYTSDRDSSWCPLWIVYLKDEVCVFWVQNNDKRRPFLQIFKTDLILGDSDEERFKVAFECQLEPKEHWSKIVTKQGDGTREMMRSRFVSHDFSKCVIMYNNRNHFPGFVWKKSTRQWVALDDSCIENNVKSTIANSWADGTQAFFPFDTDILITTATKALMAVWSLETGQLLRVIRLGTAEGLLGGQIDDRFVLFHFPDESQGDSEKMFIMAKLYNLNFIGKPESEDEKEEARSFPVFSHKAIKKAYTLLLAPHLLVYEDGKDGIIFDLKKFEAVYRGVLQRDDSVMKDIPNIPPEYYQFVTKAKQRFPARNFQKLKESGSLPDEDVDEDDEDVKRSEDCSKAPSEADGEAKEMVVVGNELARVNKKLMIDNSCTASYRISDENKTLQYQDTDLILESGSNVMWAESFAGKSDLGFFDADRGLFLQVEKHHSFFVLNKKLQHVWVVEKNVTRLQNDETYPYHMHIVRRPGHSGQALISYIRKAQFTTMTKATVTMNWEGCVDIVDYAAIDSQKTYDKNRAEECGLSITKGAIFDAGPVLHFLSDGCHVINYRLRIHDFVTGEIKKEIVPNHPDFLFVNSLLSRDNTFILGFHIERPYEVDFEIDEKPDEDESIAEDPPRNLQVRLID